jgi:hypothetical protein
MKKLFLLALLISSLFPSCTKQVQQPEAEITKTTPLFEANEAWRWVLVLPENTEACELWLTFLKNGSLVFGYNQNSFPGDYRFDDVLNNYVYINIPDRPSWNNGCTITPQYLSLYDDSTDFAFTMTDDFLYLQKNEKVLKFKKEITV